MGTEMKLNDVVKIAKYYAKPARAKQFANHMVPHVVRPAQIIWNKLLGALFGIFAVAGFNLAYSRQNNPASVAMGLFFGVVMLGFCISSFWRARRLGRMQAR